MPLGIHWLKHFDPPICFMCRTKMLFVKAEPEEPWFKLRKFKCRTCSYMETDLVKYGPRFNPRSVFGPSV